MEKEYTIKEEGGKKTVEWEENVSSTIRKSATEEEIDTTIAITQKQIDDNTMELEKLNQRLAEFTELKAKLA